ncbi:MAG: alcohol dehydrogenase [Betaproteobacteria bacterium HGW-Betaproteobacteria-1]|jgi:propanol-preferring alcohol dehydrogenase|nr:MAG: alcohol dehydrogenase [Betaproteobacteria bacterium HGW-Betaproteobacteria-1]
MKAMLLEHQNRPLRYADIPDPSHASDQVLLRVLACGVCRTDLHILDGDLTQPKLPLVLGHEIVGEVIDKGANVDRFLIGDRVGVPWLGWTCGQCRFCLSGRENLCDQARFTGYQIDGGFAELTVADQRYCFPIDDYYTDSSAAPLLCAGLIGHRALKLAGNGKYLGIYGFGAAAHLVTQVALAQGWRVYAFTREHDVETRKFAINLGVSWAGSSGEMPPVLLDAALIFAPVGGLVPKALKASAKGATIVCAGIHMTDIPAFPYALLWGERTIRSVANLTREDGSEFLALAAGIPVNTHTVVYPLSQANEAMNDLRAGNINGAAVLVPSLG